jgi:hypothetical protein
MPADVREILTDAATTPSALPDVETLWQRGRTRRRRRLVTGSVAAGAVATVVIVGITLGLTESRNQPTVSTPPNAPGARPGHWITYRDTVNGFSVRIPPGWAFASPCALLLDRGRRVSVPGCRLHGTEITYTPRSAPQTTTGPFNTVLLAANNAAQSPPGSDLLCGVIPPGAIFLREALPTGSATAPVRPHQFGLTSGTGLQPVPVPPQTPGCPAQASLTQNVNFTDRGRAFSVGVGFATTESTSAQHETYEVLNSLRFLRPSQLHGRARTDTSCNTSPRPLPSAVPGTSVKASGTNGGGCFTPCSTATSGCGADPAGPKG